ncbi:MAG TPA: uroporphyrinogen decarboxylase family protein [Polyangia bacterium]
MTGLERLTAAVRFERPDRVPVLPQVFGHAARLAGVPLRDYLTTPGELARCQLGALERYGADAVFALLDVNVETEALGSRLRYEADVYPSVERHALAAPSAVAGLQVPDPTTAGRMPLCLDAARGLRRAVGDAVAVVGCVLGPMTLACQLLGAERALYAAVDAPEDFERLLDFAVAVELRFGQAQLEAGAHLCAVFEPSASPAVVPPALFRELLAGRLRRLNEGLTRAGSLANWLHVAGPVLPILPLYRACRADIGNIDYCVAPEQARAAVPALCLDGNVRPLAFVDAEPDAIAAAAAAALAAAGPTGFILSSGCEIPLEARPECVDALVAAARLTGG